MQRLSSSSAKWRQDGQRQVEEGRRRELRLGCANLLTPHHFFFSLLFNVGSFLFFLFECVERSFLCAGGWEIVAAEQTGKSEFAGLELTSVGSELRRARNGATTVSHEAPGYLGHQRKDNVRKISREQMRCILFVCSPRAESRGEIDATVVGCTEAMKVGSRLYLWSADLSSLLLFFFFYCRREQSATYYLRSVHKPVLYLIPQ